MIAKDLLLNLYVNQKLSSKQISVILGISQNKVNYWMKLHGIQKRAISDAVYVKSNPNGDPFRFVLPTNSEMAFLHGLGLGLYWGEGNKKNKYSVRLGNTDPKMVAAFICFLEKIYGIDRSKLKFGLQLFNDSKIRAAVDYWKDALKIEDFQMQKPIVSQIRGVGSYTTKSKYGVLTIYFNNKKLRDLLCSEIEKLVFV